MWRTLLLAAAILGGSGVAQVVGMPVSVRFGALYWIDAQGGAPEVAAGRVRVPLVAACDLLGLTCPVSGRAAVVNGVRVPVTAGRVALRDLIAARTPFTLTFDARSRTAVVGTPPNVDMIAVPWMRAEQDWGLTLNPPYRGPLRAQRGAPERAPSRLRRYGLTSGGGALGGVTLLGRLPAGVGSTAGGLTVVGAQAPFLPDTPNRDPGCGARPRCEGRADVRALWVLAAVEAAR
ncbi:hypothetical protein [Deinococcus radiotolerans]|uniref:Copper amine oxidase-like N-terminal domain-containing protein n=1 Tax=Deinococcus radiotolerans TaxID=1309407 RepID=A0ABQ2FL83_9DEIO|nr:hypothetical protein [Deinococcus radiotolerans]GGL09136.1 hypothetical protein GCM10010844_29830 [Deinococcus radiotolerans]